LTLFAQRLARDVVEVVELQEEVTRAWVAVIMAGAWETMEEKIAQERVVLLASTRGEADEATQKASLLEGELVAARRP
jgi:hypothetical protein